MKIAVIGRTQFLFNTIVEIDKSGHDIIAVITAPASAEYSKKEDVVMNILKEFNYKIADNLVLQLFNDTYDDKRWKDILLYGQKQVNLIERYFNSDVRALWHPCFAMVIATIQMGDDTESTKMDLNFENTSSNNKQYDGNININNYGKILCKLVENFVESQKSLV